MNDFIYENFAKPPKGKKAVTNQIGFCFITALVILFVVSSLVTNVYSSSLQSQRKTALTSYTASSSVVLSSKELYDGMTFPLELPEYATGKHYTVNVFVKGGNSFTRVYTSDRSHDEIKPYVLSGVGEEYMEAFDQQQLIVSHRRYDNVQYVTSVAPVIGADGTMSGIVEVMIPKADFEFTENGMSLSWIFTIISIAVAIAVIYSEMYRLLDTLVTKPNMNVPRAVIYGTSTYRLIAFFSSVGCTMPLVVLSAYLKDSLKDVTSSNSTQHIWILVACLFYLMGFWRFTHLRDLVIRKLTSRIAVIVSVLCAFILLLICGLVNVPFLVIFLQLPIGFFLGMLFQFQRDYRIQADRTGMDEFSDRKIHQCQYAGYVLGAAVGAVICGILYERFGLFTVLMVASAFLFIDAIQVLYFVRHCPPSNEPIVRLPNYFYALKNSKSGTFCWSTIFPLGIQFAFFLVFIPDYLEKVRISLATVSFYYLLAIVCGQVIMRILIIWFEDFFSAKMRITTSAILSGIGYLVFALSPSAKMLVVGVTFLGLSLGLHEFGYLTYYKSLIRQDKHPVARVILMRTFTCGILIGTIVFTVANAFESVRVPMIAITLIMIVISASYPLLMLMDNSSAQKSSDKRPKVVKPRNDGEV